MDASSWYLVIGLVLVFMAFARTSLKRLPLTAALVYLAIGAALGPQGIGAFRIALPRHAALLERATEVVVLSALFTAGLRLRLPLGHESWRTAFRLASIGMLVSVALIACGAYFGLGLSLGQAILLGGALSPTDPVLAADVQVTNESDRDHVRFSLTAEAGLNDGTAFPFVVLGLALMTNEGASAGALFARWLAQDVLWGSVAGLALGYFIGWCAARVVLVLRRYHRENFDFDEFLALGVIALTYAVSHFLHCYGFLGVFASGLAFRHIEMRGVGLDRQGVPHEQREGDARSEMTSSLLQANEQLERLGEVFIVVLVGAMLTAAIFNWRMLAFASFVLVVCRPVAAWASFPRGTRLQKRLLAWFGVRGVGSVYYIAFAMTALRGTGVSIERSLVDALFTCVALSAVVHGVSVTPLMAFYTRALNRAARRKEHARAP